MKPTPRTPPTASQNDFASLIKRRRALALASTALGLAGCGMMPSPASAPTVATDRQAVDEQVRAYTSDIEQRLDPVDKERLRAAAEKKPAGPASQAPVILASAGGETSAGHASAGHAAEAPAAHADTGEPVKATAAVKAESIPQEPGAAAAPTAAADKTAEKSVNPSESPAAAGKPVEKPGASASAEVSASPLSSDSGTAVRTAVITPVAAPAATPAAAMGSMNAVASAQGGNTAGPAPVTGPPETAEPSVEEALAVLKKNIATHPTLGTSLALALLDNASAADAEKGLSESDQQVFKDLLGALENMKTEAPEAHLAQRAAPLLDAARKWQADEDLNLPRLVLATRVDSFGVFTPIEPVFEQGKRRTVIIYCEVANFASQKGSDGWYTTHLTQRETLMTDDADKLMVWRSNEEDVEDRSLNQRHDFYLVKKLTIPENLAAGKYHLVMNVGDKISGKKNIIVLPIEIK